MSVDDEFDSGDGDDPDRQEVDESRGVEVVTVADEQGRGVYLTCAAQLPPAALVEGLLDLLGQVTRAALARPGATRAGELGLGDDVF